MTSTKRSEHVCDAFIEYLRDKRWAGWDRASQHERDEFRAVLEKLVASSLDDAARRTLITGYDTRGREIFSFPASDEKLRGSGPHGSMALVQPMTVSHVGIKRVEE
jgi:hypothetical protein